MSDPRFARLKTDPRFRKPKKSRNQVVVDDRFKSVFDSSASTDKSRGMLLARLVDKYGRKVSKTKNQDDLRRFYRLEDDQQDSPAAPDYARGEGLVESSDEGEDAQADQSEESDFAEEDDSKPITLGRATQHSKQQSSVNEDGFPEIDLDEDNFADLDAQASAYSKKYADEDTPGASTSKAAAASNATSRLAVVNLDWDHVKSSHLFKIFSSVVPSANGRPRVLSVRIYPSQFGKERMEREELEGPPPEVFLQNGKKDEEMDEEDVNEETIFQTGDDKSLVNNDALRKYQLERLRYFYAVVSFDSPESAAVAYSEMDGTELERSANMFDLSFVPESMSFDDDVPRDEATNDNEAGFGAAGGLDFVTDALRHSKVKLTWDDDDAQRVKVTRKKLTKKQMEENDYRAYIASSSEHSSSDNDDEEDDVDNQGADATNEANPDASTTSADPPKRASKPSKAERRAKLRELLLNNDELPEGWGNIDGNAAGGSDKDLQVTFTPGLSSRNQADSDNDEENETTLERYQRRQREKKAAKKAKKDAKEATRLGITPVGEKEKGDSAPAAEDDFFGEDSDNGAVASTSTKPSKENKTKGKGRAPSSSPPPPADVATPSELALLLAPENAANGMNHFDMKEVIRAEKAASKKGKKNRFDKKKRPLNDSMDNDGVLREDGAGFAINVADSRFAALHDEPAFAIDPSHPQYKSTKSMSALIQERSRRQKEKSKKRASAAVETPSAPARSAGNGAALGSLQGGGGDLSSLVESVKRKAQGQDKARVGKRDAKRRKL
ncbi:hypothetical protein DL93DRAFT_2110555 [Clavulina sp. PMI_390]|nr:hypothetical protein DL93DRAFT_2110555 [Clavulina sp. PMI_390]